MLRPFKLDAPFWALVMIVILSLASLGCFAQAAAQRASFDAPVLTTNFACPPPADI